MAKPVWSVLGPADLGKISGGVITLPTDKEGLVGGDDVVLVRRRGNGAVKQGRGIRLKVSFGTLTPIVSENDEKRLGVTEAGTEIEARRLSRMEKRGLRAARLALPVLAFVAGVAALVGGIFSDLKDTMEIVTAAAAIPAALAAVLDAILRT